MRNIQERIPSYDLMRSLAIVTVFLAHIIGFEENKESFIFVVFSSLSPGLTMSLLGFISAALLSARAEDSGVFLLRRLIRIYVPLACCLLIILCIHAAMGKKTISQHALLHLMGLSAFFDLLQVQNKSTIGQGLWFITAIVTMYFTLPILRNLFKHSRGGVHVTVVVLSCIILNNFMYGTASVWNVVASFSVGVYLSVNQKLEQLFDANVRYSLTASFTLLIVAFLATAGVVPYGFRSLLFPLYPLAFVPLLHAISKELPQMVTATTTFFATISYEFYILHFYFINENLRDFVATPIALPAKIALSFSLTAFFAYVVSRIASKVCTMIYNYAKV